MRGSNGTGSQLLRVTATTYSRVGQIAQMTLKPSFRLPADKWDDFNVVCLNLFLVNLTSILVGCGRYSRIIFYCFELAQTREYSPSLSDVVSLLYEFWNWLWPHCTAVCLIIYIMAAGGWHITNHIPVITARVDD